MCQKSEERAVNTLADKKLYWFSVNRNSQAWALRGNRVYEYGV